MNILVLNAGSSSQKSCLYQLTEASPTEPLTPAWEAKVDWSHAADTAELEVQTATGAKLQEQLPATSRLAVMSRLLETLWTGDTQVLPDASAIHGVGHRVVHGGQRYRDSTLITPEVKAAIAQLCELAPAHNPVNLEGIEIIEETLGAVPQVAVFDTAFHSQLPQASAVYPGPYEWLEQDIRRYGFHGISHQYCAERAAQLLGHDLSSLKLITCHLGNGCSLAAIQNGHSIDTTMGFTPLEGLMMGSRSGSIDPGILIYLLRHQNYTADQLDQLLNKQSGLKGISGISGDMRAIQQAIADQNPRARLAFEIYIHRLRSQIGAMIASLQGLDVLVFTGGVGENSAMVRAAACEAFGFLGLQLDLNKNNASPVDQDIATSESAVRVLVIHTQEDWAIAKACWQLLQ